MEHSQTQELLREIHTIADVAPPLSMGPVVNDNGWQISSAVPIDTETGTLRSGCLANCKLDPVPLSDGAWKVMGEMNETIALQLLLQIKLTFLQALLLCYFM